MLFSWSISQAIRSAPSRGFSTSLPALAVYPTVYVSHLPKIPSALSDLQSRLTAHGLTFTDSRLLPSLGTAKTQSAVFEVESEDEEGMGDVFDVGRKFGEENGVGEMHIYLNSHSENSAFEPDDSKLDVVNLPDCVPDREMFLDLLGFRLNVEPELASYHESEIEGVLSGRGTVVPRGEDMKAKLLEQDGELVEGNELLIMRSPKEKANWIV